MQLKCAFAFWVFCVTLCQKWHIAIDDDNHDGDEDA